MTTTLDRGALSEDDNAVLWFTRDGIVSKLRQITAEVRRSNRVLWATRITEIAYGRGFDVGLHARSNTEGRNPYGRSSASNFLRGKNDPQQAWADGFFDGFRVRQIITHPEFVRDLLRSEYRLLPKKLQERVDGAAI